MIRSIANVKKSLVLIHSTLVIAYLIIELYTKKLSCNFYIIFVYSLLNVVITKCSKFLFLSLNRF